MSSLLAIICFILIGPVPPPSLLYSLRMRGPGFHVGTRLRREFVGGGGRNFPARAARAPRI